MGDALYWDVRRATGAGETARCPAVGAEMALPVSSSADNSAGPWTTS